MTQKATILRNNQNLVPLPLLKILKLKIVSTLVKDKINLNDIVAAYDHPVFVWILGPSFSLFILYSFTHGNTVS